MNPHRNVNVAPFETLIHRKKKDGGCTFYHNTLRFKLSPLGMV